MIQPPENPYPGINAHINSFMQGWGGGRESFHLKHIHDLTNEVNAHLPDTYYGIAWEMDTKAMAIYHVEAGQYPGKAVTRVELLSPANKPSGSHCSQYLVKRQETLEARLRLVEIDYLHETPPVLHIIPSYVERAPNSLPYTIIISDPRPTPQEGPTNVYGFGVDEPIPALEIPLDGKDTVRLDFGAVYKQTFKNMRVFRFIADYRRDPDRMETYHSADQERIRQRMAAIANML